MNLDQMKEYVLENEYLKVHLLNFGASIYKIYVKKDTTCKQVLSTPNNYKDFMINSLSFGKTIGRAAGRVYKNERTEQFINFEDESYVLHGGKNGLGNQYFNVCNYDVDHVTFMLNLESYSDQFKGNLEVKVIYQIINCELKITYETLSSEDTLCNITCHPYFNLEGSDNLNQHTLKVSSTQILLRNEKGIFDHIGQASVFDKDFTKERQLNVSKDFELDDIFIIDDNKNVLELKSNGIKLSVQTTYPTLVLYTQNNETNTDLSNINKNGKYAGIAIECQKGQNTLPILRANQKEVHETSYIFSRIIE